MGQIIRLPVIQAPYPDHAAALDPAECVLLIAIRWWVDAIRRDEDPMPRLRQGLGRAGAHDAAFSIDALMTVIARSIRQPIGIHGPRCPRLSDDEKRLLHAASLAQAGGADRAEIMLRDTLLSAHGAGFARGPLQGLGALFAAAGLFFRARRPPAGDQAPINAADLRIPSTSSGTIH